MKIEIDNVKGFQDYLPPESLKREAVRKVIEKYFKLYGFLPVETPIVEFDEIMRAEKLPTEQEDEAVSDRFRLKDRAGRELGLRYEFTFQLARIFKLNPNLKLPFKRYQIGPVFRDEPIGANRFRQFVQCDADIIGDNSIDADAECFAMMADIFKELKIPVETYVNNRKLLNSIIESVQIDQPRNVMKELDKLDKVGEDVVKMNIKKYADSNQVITLFKLLEKDLKFFVDNAFDGAKELDELIIKCREYDVKLNFSPYLVRGFGYYTGTIFEIKMPGKSTISAGGRYDKTVGKYLGRDIPAVGISFGLERVAELATVDMKTTKAVLISFNKEEETIELSKKLRKAGISCVLFFNKVSKALEYANSYQIPYVIFIGEEELSKKKVKLRDMKSGEEKLISEKQVIDKLS